MQLLGAGHWCHLLTGKQGVPVSSYETHPRPLKCREDEGGDLGNLTLDCLLYPGRPRAFPSPPPFSPIRTAPPSPAPHPPQPGLSPQSPAGTRCPGLATMQMQPGLWLLLATQLAGKTGKFVGRGAGAGGLPGTREEPEW